MTLVGSDAAGVFYGVQTLLQALQVSSDGAVSLPCMDIRDWPDIKLRGHMLNLRQFRGENVEACRAFFRALARFKVNALEFDAYNQVRSARQRRGTSLTKTELAAISGVAADYFVDILPLFEFAPSGGWLTHYPELAEFDPAERRPEGGGCSPRPDPLPRRVCVLPGSLLGQDHSVRTLRATMKAGSE